MTWTYKVENLGDQTAKGVKMEKVAVRNCYCGSHGIQTETSYENLGDLPGGAVKNIVVSCAPKNLAPPCDSSSAEAHLTNTDSNPRQQLGDLVISHVAFPPHFPPVPPPPSRQQGRRTRDGPAAR